MTNKRGPPPYHQAQWEPIHIPLKDYVKEDEYQTFQYPITRKDGSLFNGIKNMGWYHVGYEKDILFLSWELYVPEDQQARLTKAWMQFDFMDLCHFYGENTTKINLHGKPSPYNFEMQLWDLMHIEKSITDKIIFFGKQNWKMTILNYTPFERIALFRHKHGHILELTFHWHSERDDVYPLKKGTYHLKLMVGRL